MNARVGGNPELAKVGLGGESRDPKVGSEDQTEEAAEGNEIARELEPSTGGSDHTRDGHEEGDEDEDGVDDTSCLLLVLHVPTIRPSPNHRIGARVRTGQRELLREQLGGGIDALFRCFVHGVLVDEGVTEENGSGDDEDCVGGHVGQQHLVRHGGLLS